MYGWETKKPTYFEIPKKILTWRLTASSPWEITTGQTSGRWQFHSGSEPCRFWRKNTNYLICAASSKKMKFLLWSNDKMNIHDFWIGKNSHKKWWGFFEHLHSTPPLWNGGKIVTRICWWFNYVLIYGSLLHSLPPGIWVQPTQPVGGGGIGDTIFP